LVGCQEEHLACKNLSDGWAWHGLEQGADDFAYGSADATATPSSLAS